MDTRIGQLFHSVVDRDTGKKVGTLECRQGMTLSNRRYHSRTISLFDGKYLGSFETHAECVAFAIAMANSRAKLLKNILASFAGLDADNPGFMSARP